MLFLLTKFLRDRENADKLAEFYFQNIDMLLELKNRYPNWQSYVSKYLSDEVCAGLRERGVPL